MSDKWIKIYAENYIPDWKLVFLNTQKFWSTANTLKKSAATSHVRRELKSWI